MRLAVIADVHSNLHALSAVITKIQEASPDLVVCAGDVVGYGAFPNECCEIVHDLAEHTVLGNHEVSALARDTSFMNPYAAKALLWTADRLNEKSRNWLRSLEKEARFAISGLRVSMYHGSVESYSEYVYEEETSESMLARGRCELLLLGHTHVPYFKRFKTGIILNPGSVGQPRDGDPRASHAIFESDTMNCRIVRTTYDVDKAADAISREGLPSFLQERLYVGR